jgi:hypothetical protein
MNNTEPVPPESNGFVLLENRYADNFVPPYKTISVSSRNEALREWYNCQDDPKILMASYRWNEKLIHLYDDYTKNVIREFSNNFVAFKPNQCFSQKDVNASPFIKCNEKIDELDNVKNSMCNINKIIVYNDSVYKKTIHVALMDCDTNIIHQTIKIEFDKSEIFHCVKMCKVYYLTGSNGEHDSYATNTFRLTDEKKFSYNKDFNIHIGSTNI